MQTSAHFYTLPQKQTPEPEKLDIRGLSFVYLHRRKKTTYYRPQNDVFLPVTRWNVKSLGFARYEEIVLVWILKNTERLPYEKPS